MNSMQPGWYPDPFGRFARRYHDGRAWTEHVADQQGTQLRDAAPVSGQSGDFSGFQQQSQWQQPAPQPAQWSAPGYTPPTQQWTAPAPVSTSPSIGAYLGVIIAGVGALLVVLGLFALDWLKLTSGGQSSSGGRSDVSTFITDIIEDSGGSTNFLSKSFFGWGWIIVLLIAIVGVVAALSKIPALRIGAAVAAVVAFLWVLFGWLNLKAYVGNDSNASALNIASSSLSIGGWLTLLGLAAVAVGAFLGGPLIGAGTSTRTSTTTTPSTTSF